MNYILEAYAVQDVGFRTSQQDSFYPPFIDPCHSPEIPRDWAFYDGTAHTDDRLFIVCDGMGGHDRGELASRLVTQTMSKSLLRSAPVVEGAFNDDLIHQAAREALRALADKDLPGEVMKMGTTMTILKFHADGATIGHIGDSRVYHFRPGQQAQPPQILFRTEDHTFVNDLVHQGKLTPAQAMHSSKRHVLSRSMMSCQEKDPEVDIYRTTDIKVGDVFLLCTDGMYENMDDDDLLQLMTDPNYSDVQRIQTLLHKTKNNRDNHTAYVVRVQDILNTPDKMAPDASLTPGTVLKSENYTYHIEKVLGHGSFGITYLVNTSVSMQGQLGTIHTGVKVALKEFYVEKEMKRVGSELTAISPDSNVQIWADKFRREAKKLAMLSHPNIVRVLEVFEANNTIYYSMEYLPDGNMNSYVNKRGGIPEKEAIGCIRQIGSALMYMHTNKMLHLDVKPANIMRVESSNTLKIIDFGLSKRFEENGDPETSANLGFGTPGYASLEQADGNIDHEFAPELDVYAIGATYYKILTGVTPNSAIDVLNRGLNTMPLVKKNVSQKSIDAIKAAMEPTKAKRLGSIEAFLAMLPRVDDVDVLQQKKARNFWYTTVLPITVTVILLLCFVFFLHRKREMQSIITDTTEMSHAFDIEMVDVEGGTFTMGCVEAGNPDVDADEGPLHEVTVSAFSIGKYEVTKAQWCSVMNNEEIGKSKNATLPVHDVSWDEVQEFIKRLNERTGRHFRLPTEAEWEYAARGGNKDAGTDAFGEDSVSKTTWFEDNSGARLHPVGQLRPNELGLYDMGGNVWEYCSDWYGPYTDSKVKDPKGPKDGSSHVIRGGSWQSPAQACRATYRQDDLLALPTPAIGFRLVENK